MVNNRSADDESIPLPIISYVDKRLSDHTAKIEALLLQRMLEIQTEMRDQNDKADRRHHALVDSITAYMGRQEMIDRAFMKDDDGHPDYHGHFNDHFTRHKWSQWWQSVREKTAVKVFEWGAVVIIAWIALTLWRAFLEGPTK